MPGLFKSRGQTSTFDTNKTGTSTTTGQRSPRQDLVFQQVLDQLRPLIQAGPQVTQAERNQMRTGVNKQYNAITPQMESGLTSRGFGDSGKLGAAFKNLAFARAGDIQTGELALKDKAQQRYASLLQAAYPFTRPETYTTNSSEHATGSQTRPGPSLFDQLLGYAGDIAGIALGFGWNPFGGGGPFNAAGTGSAGGVGYSIPGSTLDQLQI